jgi:hypothetical protein
LPANKALTETPKKKLSVPPAAYAIGMMLAIGLAGFWYLNRKAQEPPAPPPPLTGAAKAYVRSLKLSEVSMEAHESYMKQQVVEITGKIGNAGDRVLEQVVLYCVFRDPYGQVVLRERVPIVSKKMGGLAPNDVKPFRMPFDSIPEGWNQALPDLVIAEIDFS